MAEKTFTLSQALDYLDNLEVSSNSEEKYLGALQSAKIYLQSPLNSNRPSSDVDSGEENTVAADTSNLSDNQLLGFAAFEIKWPRGIVIVEQSEDTATKAPVQKANGQKKDNSQHVNKWIHSDISPSKGGKWTLPDPVLETVEPPVSLSEKFFTDDIMKFICDESIRYGISKGNHNFTIDTIPLKAFIAILLVSGYVDLRRGPMYWEHNEGTHNTTVSSSLSRNRFDEIVQNFHLAENSNLDKEDNFPKVRPLIDKLNEQCLANYLPEQSVSTDDPW